MATVYKLWLINLLHTAQSFLWSCPVHSNSRNFPHFTYPEGSLPIHKYPTPVPILSQINSIHKTISHFLKINLNIILPSATGFLKLLLSLRFPQQKPVYPSPLPIHFTYQNHLFYIFIITTLLFEQYRKLSSSLCSSLHSSLPRPSYPQISPSTPHFQTPSSYLLS